MWQFHRLEFYTKDTNKFIGCYHFFEVSRIEELKKMATDKYGDVEFKIVLVEG